MSASRVDFGCSRTVISGRTRSSLHTTVMPCASISCSACASGFPAKFSCGACQSVRRRIRGAVMRFRRGPVRVVSVEQRLQLGSDPAEALAEERLLATEPDAEVPFETDVSPGDDQRGLIQPNAVGDGLAWRVR